MTTIGDTKIYVRSYLDTDEEDLPDLFLDVWAQQGYNEMVAIDKRWPSMEKDSTFTTEVDTQSYALGSTGDSIEDCRTQDVENVMLDDYPLTYGDHLRLRAQYPVSSNSTGQPMYYSLWAGSMWLWPTPSSALTVTVSYYRRPTAWLALGAGAEPDLPTEFHLPLQEYVLAHAYLRDEDAELADAHMRNYGRMFETLRKAELAAHPQRPLILNGDRRRRSSVGRLRYPFDGEMI